MENLKKRIDIKLVSNKEDDLKWTSKPSYMLYKIFVVQKPAYIGMCTLELSKVLMYKFHYDYIKNKFDNNSRLLFTDTDSLMYEIKTEDVYPDFSNNKEMFDFNNYSTKSKYYDNSNKLVVGNIKDETAGAGIKEIVGLIQKIYSYLVDDNSEHKKAKSGKKMY